MLEKKHFVLYSREEIIMTRIKFYNFSCFRIIVRIIIAVKGMDPLHENASNLWSPKTFYYYCLFKMSSDVHSSTIIVKFKSMWVNCYLIQT